MPLYCPLYALRLDADVSLVGAAGYKKQSSTVDDDRFGCEAVSFHRVKIRQHFADKYSKSAKINREQTTRGRVKNTGVSALFLKLRY